LQRHIFPRFFWLVTALHKIGVPKANPIVVRAKKWVILSWRNQCLDKKVIGGSKLGNFGDNEKKQ